MLNKQEEERCFASKPIPKLAMWDFGTQFGLEYPLTL